jgi:hypothetical protein
MAITNITADATAGVNELRRMNSNLTNGSTTTAITFKAMVQLDQTNDAGIFIATTGTHGLAFNAPEKDCKYVYIIRNVGTSKDQTVLIKAGNAEQYGATKNLSITAKKATAAGSGKETTYVDTAIQLDSAKYMQFGNSWNGQIVFLGASADVQIAQIRLP